MTDRLNLEDPRFQYPRPPFPRQTQRVPALVEAMYPLPDPGEQTCEGNERLAGRKALVTGGDSGIGRAVAIAFAGEGADVALSYLEEEQSDAQAVLDLIETEGRKGVSLPATLLTRPGVANLSTGRSKDSEGSTLWLLMLVTARLALR